MRKSREQVPGQASFLVLGGYGHVGRIVCERLGRRHSGRVVAAGRSLDAASAFASTTAGRVSPMALDVRDTARLTRAVGAARIVVNCVEASNLQVAEACIDQGKPFVDISASYAILQSIERLHERARASGATGLLSVGLAPGATNLLAVQARDAAGGAQSAEIALLLGLGGGHGPDAIRWTLENGRGARGRKRVRLPEPYGWRTAFPFDFADQHVIPTTLGIRQARTRLCLDPAALTFLLAAAGATGLLGLAGRAGALGPLAGLLSHIHMGSDVVVAQVEAFGPSATARAWLAGRDQSLASGVIAAEVAARLLAAPPRPGVMHVEQAFAPEMVLGALAAEGFCLGCDSF